VKILVTGADGQLGKELLLQGRESGFRLIAADLPELDVTAADDVGSAIDRYRPFLVINAAAYTQVDKAETQPSLAYRVNAEGPAILAKTCAAAGIALIHISTDYVFSGEKNTPYTETDPVAPTGVYARSKADGEVRVRSLLPRHIILRTSWLYGVSGHNFVRTMLRLGRERKVIRVVNGRVGPDDPANSLKDSQRFRCPVGNLSLLRRGDCLLARVRRKNIQPGRALSAVQATRCSGDFN